jgi:hypothetical protein
MILPALKAVLEGFSNSTKMNISEWWRERAHKGIGINSTHCRWLEEWSRR